MISPVRPHPALLIRRKKERILVIADLHIGWEMALTQEGVHIPSQTHKLLNKLNQLIKTTKPTTLIFLGDIKHSVATTQLGEWQDIPNFFEAINKKIPEIKVIPGNHDGNLEPLLPKNIQILPSTGTTIGTIGLFHGHTWPAPQLLKCKTLVIGHIHPIVMFYDPLKFRVTRQVWVKANCNSAQLAKALLKRLNIKVKQKNLTKILQERYNVKLNVSQFLIMPSFNNFLGGQPINRKGVVKNFRYKMFISPILRSGSIDMDSAEIYLLDGSFLGTLGRLRTLSFL